jgi:hypothetical protein
MSDAAALGAGVPAIAAADSAVHASSARSGAAATRLTPGSALWRGHVAHARFGPVPHRFRYGLFMTALDLDALAAPGGLGLGAWLDPSRPRSLLRLRRKDHLGDPRMPLKDAVISHVQAELADFVPGPVLLLTHLAQFGVRFNPVNFYFCFAPDGERLAAIVLEVNSTPWGEQHCYVLDCRGSEQPYKFVQAKAFTVSPFLPVDMEYRFRFEVEAGRLAIHKENWCGATRVFHAVLTLRRTPLTRASILGALAQYPLMTWKVVTTIYFEALRLWVKGVPFIGHQRSPPPVQDDKARTRAQEQQETQG